jgi:SEC-C motif-containing protein
MRCPCDSGKAFEHCCGPLLAGAPAPTAEALMRSRFTAYARHEMDYLEKTCDPATRGRLDREAMARWARGSTWLGLKVVATEKGGEADSEGVVEFTAFFKQSGREQTHHERALFRKMDGRWFYVEAEASGHSPLKREERPGPNDPCSCGSGKKFKRCHGR